MSTSWHNVTRHMAAPAPSLLGLLLLIISIGKGRKELGEGVGGDARTRVSNTSKVRDRCCAMVRGFKTEMHGGEEIGEGCECFVWTSVRIFKKHEFPFMEATQHSDVLSSGDAVEMNWITIWTDFLMTSFDPVAFECLITPVFFLYSQYNRCRKSDVFLSRISEFTNKRDFFPLPDIPWTYCVIYLQWCIPLRP